MCPQGIPQAALAAMGQIKQFLVVPANQRTFQDHRQVQIILRQQQETAQGNQIHQRQLLGQDHAVNTGHGDAPAFQGADHGLDKIGPPLHQDQNISWSDRPALSDQHFLLFQPFFNLSGDALGQPGHGAILI